MATKRKATGKAAMTRKGIGVPAGPTVPPKTKRNVTKAQTQVKPKKARARTGKGKGENFDGASRISAPKPRSRLVPIQPEEFAYPSSATNRRVAIPDRGYNYTDASYTGRTPYERRWEIDQAQMNAQVAGERRRRGEVITPDEIPVYPRPEAPKQWAIAPKVRKTTIKRKV